MRERGPQRRPPTSRSYLSIVRANVFTVFNLDPGRLRRADARLRRLARRALPRRRCSPTPRSASPRRSRAKRELDRLAAARGAAATVVRDGDARAVGAGGARAGRPRAACSPATRCSPTAVVRADGAALDESILTGESEPSRKGPATRCFRARSSSRGRGAVRGRRRSATTSYAARLTGQARAFRHPRSPLELRDQPAAAAAAGGHGRRWAALLGGSLWRRDARRRGASPTATAGDVELVPEGLVLLASLTFAVAAVRMARRGALAQQLNAIESLAAADVVCLDKTGTLTDASCGWSRSLPAHGGAPASRARARRDAAASAVRNLTLEAIAARVPARRPRCPAREVPFSSRAALERASSSRRDARARGARGARVGELARGAPARQRPGAGCSRSAARPTSLEGDDARAAAGLRAARARRAGRAAARTTRARRSGSCATRASTSRSCPATRRRRSAAIARRRRHPDATSRLDGATLPPIRTGCRARVSAAPSSAASRPRTSGASSRRCATRAATSRWSATASTTCPP